MLFRPGGWNRRRVREAPGDAQLKLVDEAFGGIGLQVSCGLWGEDHWDRGHGGSVQLNTPNVEFGGERREGGGSKARGWRWRCR